MMIGELHSRLDARETARIEEINTDNPSISFVVYTDITTGVRKQLGLAFFRRNFVKVN